MNPHSVDSRRKASIRGRFAVPQDCGQSLIETALVLPLLLLMAFNAINFGYFFFAAINLAAAPRNAVVYSVQGFATPGQLVLPKAGPACAGGTSTDKSVSTLTYNDITGVLPTSSGAPCPNVARVQVCSESVGLTICAGRPSTVAKVVRSTSCRRTISSTLRASAATSSGPASWMAIGIV